MNQAILPAQSEMTDRHYQIARKVEHIIVRVLSKELEMDELDIRDREFLLSVWAHFFSNSAVAMWYSEEVSQQKFLPNYLNIPADTEAFLGLNRSIAYAGYLRVSLHQDCIDDVLKVERQVKVLDVRHMRGYRVLLYKPGFNKVFKLLLTLTSLGKIRSESRKIKLEQSGCNSERRSQIAELLASQLTEFTFARWLAIRAVEFLPAIFLESYRQVVNVYSSYNNSIGRIFSRDCWSSDDGLKFFSVLAKGISNGRVLRIGSPHALNYGTLKDFWLREYEVSYIDKYLAWGRGYCNALPFYNTYYSGMLRPSNFQKLSGQFEILITGASRPSHLIEYPYTVAGYMEYLSRQIQLADELGKRTSHRVTIRTRQKERGRELESLISALGERSFAFEYQGLEFSKRVRNCLHITDNTSTTLIETLWLNHPTIVLIEPGYFEIWQNALADFELLEKVGIFHTSRKSVIDFVLKNLEKINEWWGGAETQDAVRLFLERQGRPGGTLKEWKKILLGESK